MISTSDRYFSTLKPTLEDFFAGHLPAREAASILASITLSPTEQGLFHQKEERWYDEYDDQNTTERLWTCLLQLARESPRHHTMLVDLFLQIAALPSPVDPDNGEPLRDVSGVEYLYWKEMPRLSWKVNAIYNSFSIPLGFSSAEHASLMKDLPAGVRYLATPVGISFAERMIAIEQFGNVNRFVARLVAADREQFNYQMFALWTFRGAAETLWKDVRPEDPLEAYVRAALGWVEVLGEKIFDFEDAWVSGTYMGDRGRGGPLWKGKHGFCKERWTIWRERFGKIAGGEKVGRDVEDVDGTREAARKAEEIMRKIENVGGRRAEEEC